MPVRQVCRTSQFPHVTGEGEAGDVSIVIYRHKPHKSVLENHCGGTWRKVPRNQPFTEGASAR